MRTSEPWTWIRRILRRQDPAPRTSQTSGELPWLTVSDGPCAGAQITCTSFADAMADGSYDRFFYSALEDSCLQLEGATVWDVGAHVGYDSLALARLVGAEGHVIAFEPNPFNRDRLRRHLARNPALAARIHVSELALFDRDGQCAMRVSPDIDSGKSSGSYLDKGERLSDRFGEDVYADFVHMDVDVIRADSLLGTKPYGAPMCAKIDVEGAETAVLSGADRMLTSIRPVLAMEVHNIQCMFRVFDILACHRYRLELLDDGESCSSRCFIWAIPEPR